MPHLTQMGALRSPRLAAALVDCDGEDGRPTEEGVERARVWFVLRGRFDFRGRRARRAGDPATALLIGRDEPFCIRHPEGCGDLCLALAGDAVDEAVARGGPAAPIDAAAFVRLRALATRLARADAVEAIELEEAMIAALASHEPQRAARPRDRALADDVAHELALRFDERLSLADLAGPRRVSVFTLSRAFARARGIGVHRTLQRLRVRHALALMLDTDWTLARIAAECGFASHAHLTLRFRRELGVGPAAVRHGAAPMARIA
jgi:AraC-like DNA-binding protein